MTIRTPLTKLTAGFGVINQSDMGAMGNVITGYIRAGLLGLALLLASPATAFDARLVTLKVGYPPGGDYDMMTRILSRHLGRHLPGNPDVVVQNVPGSGSMRLTQLLLGSEPADGSVVAIIGSGMWMAPKLDPANADFDPLDLRWIGSLSEAPDSMCVVSKDLGIETIEDFVNGDFLLAATGPSSVTYLFAAMVKNALDARFRIVTGFDGLAEAELAIQRGEIAGHCAASAADLARPDFDEIVDVVLRVAGPESSSYAAVPRLGDLIDDPILREAVELVAATREYEFQLVAPKGTSEETVDILRAAFDSVVLDPAYVAEMEAAESRGLILYPTSGLPLENALRAKLESDPEVFELARGLVR